MTTKQINSYIILFSLFFIWLYYFFLFYNIFPLFSFSVVPNGVSKISDVRRDYSYTIGSDVRNLRMEPRENILHHFI
jgi:hypothetical protein